MGGSEGSNVISLFVQNLPPKLHWSGLRQVFGRQGDIVDSFIARKLDKTGKRFGFVRFSNRVEADRAIERLDGFRLLVAKTKFQVRTKFWRKVSQENNKRMNQEIPSKGKQEDEVRTNNRKTAGPEAGRSRTSRSDGSNDILEKRVRNIQGHVEEEAPWRLRNCLVGMMASPCSTKQVEDRLTKWGLGEIAVKNMGGRCFLLEIKDQELFSLLEEQNWSLLKEVFVEIEKWSESFHLPERITWIQITGIPIHCWNYITFKRIAELVGTLLSLGENATGFGDCEKVNLLISTKQFDKIGETIELEVGRDIFMVYVEELGLYDQGISYQNQGAKYRPCKEIDSESGYSSSVGYSEARRSKNRENNREIWINKNFGAFSISSLLFVLDYHFEPASSRQAASCLASNEDWQDAWHDGERKERKNRGTYMHGVRGAEF
ncbi:hypothetical protein V6N13_032680 [Hibiscus sabdariffa]